MTASRSPWRSVSACPRCSGRILAARGIDLDDAPRLPRAEAARAAARSRASSATWTPPPRASPRAVQAGESIAMFGDYDVDGATSAALLQRFFEAAGGAGHRLHPRPPEGGLRPQPAGAAAPARRTGAGVVVTVDCGTTAHAPLAAAAEAGLDVIVVDHHVAEPLLPRGVRHHQSEPARRDEPARPARRGRRRLPAGRRGQPRAARAPAGIAAGPSPISCNGSTSSRSARSATWCRSPGSTARWWRRG